MANFAALTTKIFYDLLINALNDIVTSMVTMLDGTTDTNLPDKAKRYNASTNQFEAYNASEGTWTPLGFHAALTAQIAAAVASAGVPIGAPIPWLTGTPPAGYVIFSGQAVNRTGAFAALFALWGTTYGAGDGTTTFNLPDPRGKHFLGLLASAAYGKALGETGGNLALTFTVPNHSHAIAAHTHTYSHTHATPNHAHAIAAHTHTVPGHGHSVTDSLATISTNGTGGAHQHNVNRAPPGGVSSSNRVATSDGTTSTSQAVTANDGVSIHSHAHGEFSGTVGHYGGGSGTNGDADFVTTGQTGGTSTAGGDGGGTTTSQSANVTDSQTGATATTSSGTCSTDTQTISYWTGNWMCRYQ